MTLNCLSYIVFKLIYWKKSVRRLYSILSFLNAADTWPIKAYESVARIVQTNYYKKSYVSVSVTKINNSMEEFTMKIFRNIIMLVFSLLVVLAFQDRSVASDGATDSTTTSDAARGIGPYFKPATSFPKAADNEGFLQRWLLLEPINKPNRTNTVFTDSYIRNAFTTEYFPNQFTVVPHDGDKVTVADQELSWHALDATSFNVKLFRFASGLDKQMYGVLFWALTVVNSPREMKNVRMAVGSNSASMWWLNGKEAVLLTGDRRMVMDDFVSKRLTLNKGPNIIRGAVINGPGMSDFCVRFINENGEPIKDITISFENNRN